MPVITDGAPLAPFRLNSLLAIVDSNGHDTGTRCRYVGLSADRDGHLTGEAHVTLIDRRTKDRTPSNVNIAIYLLRLASEIDKRQPA